MQGYLSIAGEDVSLTLAPGALADVPGAVVARDGARVWVHLDGRIHDILWRDAVTFHAGEAVAGGDALSRAPMPGSVIRVTVTVGDTVKAGDALLAIESMKMETVIRASRDGVVAAVHVAPGDGFDRDALLVTLGAE